MQQVSEHPQSRQLKALPTCLTLRVKLAEHFCTIPDGLSLDERVDFYLQWCHFYRSGTGKPLGRGKHPL